MCVSYLFIPSFFFLVEFFSFFFLFYIHFIHSVVQGLQFGCCYFFCSSLTSIVSISLSHSVCVPYFPYLFMHFEMGILCVFRHSLIFSSAFHLYTYMYMRMNHRLAVCHIFFFFYLFLSLISCFKINIFIWFCFFQNINKKQNYYRHIVLRRNRNRIFMVETFYFFFFFLKCDKINFQSRF